MTARSPDNTGTSIESGSVKEKIKMLFINRQRCTSRDNIHSFVVA
jgi:hypothetical protein